MQGSLDGPVALVTGASRGIGRGIAVGLGEAGATVYVTGRSLQPDRSTDPVGGSLAETCSAVEAAGGRCLPVAVDHTDDRQVQSLFSRIEQENQGRLDLLVNNVYGGVRALRESIGQPFWEADPGLWDACNGAGLRSHYIASVHAERLMVKRQRGLICTISSWGGLFHLFNVAYAVGKSACDRLAADRDLLRRSGTVGIVAELAATYGVVDAQAYRPASLRSLRAVLPVVVPSLASRSGWIPDLRIPWWLLLLAGRRAPRF